RMVGGDNRRKDLHAQGNVCDRTPRQRGLRRQNNQHDDAAGRNDYHQPSTQGGLEQVIRQVILSDPMSQSHQLKDRPMLLATLRDYVEQIREEGLDGLPTQAPGADAALPPAAPTPARDKVAGPRAADLFAKYPGLESKSSLEQVREFIGDCRRCKLWP